MWDVFAHLYHLPGLLDVFHAERTGLHVVTLPVTTEAAKAAGKDIWGFNKYAPSPQPTTKLAVEGGRDSAV